MWGWIVAEGALLVGSYVYHRWFEDHPKPPPIRVEGVPRTDVGAPVPIIYGRCKVTAPVVAWIGNWHVSNTNPPVYSVDMLFVAGIPFYGGQASLQQIYAGDFQLSPFPRTPEATTSPPAGVSRYGSSNGFNVYGGSGFGGGIFGEIEFYDGRPGQRTSDEINDNTVNSLTMLEQRQAREKFTSDPGYAHPSLIDETLMPGYRNQVLCFLFDWSIGESPNFTSYAFDVTALSAGTASALAGDQAADADPAAVIYDLLTSPWGKLGLPASKIDHDSFLAASTTLLAEGHGYSRAIQQPEDAASIIADILRQIDGMLYEEPTTGKLVLKLVRADYDPNNLQDINPDNMQTPGSGWLQIQGWSETFNQVRLMWLDRGGNYIDGISIAQNGANAAGQTSRALRSVDVRFDGCCTQDLAKKLAARELAAVSRPMVKATVTVNRQFYATRPGDVLTLTWPELGISKMIMRVARVDRGQLHKGAITIDLLRDIFDVAIGSFPG